MGTLPQRYFEADTGPGQVMPKRGEEIFDGKDSRDYPRTWAGFIGQVEAKAQCEAAIADAAVRNTAIDHILVASSVPGVGKTTLATLLAYLADKGLQRFSGPITQEKFLALVSTMRDGDVLFGDELHTLVAGNKNRADWILPWMLEGVVYTDHGARPTPKVTFIGATTDVAKLPATIVERFMVQLQISDYSEAEATQIAQHHANGMQVDLTIEEAELIAVAADHNPRTMQRVLTALRTQRNAGLPNNWERVFQWSGVTEDGLSTIAVNMLLVIAVADRAVASITTIQKALKERNLDRHEAQLIDRGLIEISGQGRRLTSLGAERVAWHRQAVAV